MIIGYLDPWGKPSKDPLKGTSRGDPSPSSELGASAGGHSWRPSFLRCRGGRSAFRVLEFRALGF